MVLWLVRGLAQSSFLSSPGFSENVLLQVAVIEVEAPVGDGDHTVLMRNIHSIGQELFTFVFRVILPGILRRNISTLT